MKWYSVDVSGWPGETFTLADTCDVVQWWYGSDVSGWHGETFTLADADALIDPVDKKADRGGHSGCSG